MVSKQSDRPYRSGRSRDWVKVQNRRHHAFDRVNRLLQARVDGGDRIDIGHGSSEVDAIAIKRGRDHVVAHHGHALDVHDAARRRVSCPMKLARATHAPGRGEARRDVGRDLDQHGLIVAGEDAAEVALGDVRDTCGPLACSFTGGKPRRPAAPVRHDGWMVCPCRTPSRIDR
jgi:hypothetical protein